MTPQERKAFELALEMVQNKMYAHAEMYLKEALAQPEFTKHEVENVKDWSEWVCPTPQGYLMKCCDCGLVHEAEFGVVRYKSEAERENCDMVDDPNLQAVFRMRRSEQWSPADTAHRAGGLPMAQPEQKQNLKLMPREATREMLEAMDECSMEGYDERLYAGHAGSVYMAAWDAFAHPFVPTAQPKPLDDAVLYLSSLVYALDNAFISSWQSTASWQIQLDEAKEYLTAHGIKE